MQAEITANSIGLYAAAPGLSLDPAADFHQTDGPTSTLGLNPTADTRSRDIASIGFNLHPIHFARNIDGELARKLVRPSTLPIADDPGRISVHIGADFIRIEFAAGSFLGGGVTTIADHIVDPGLRPALHPNRAHIDFDPKILGATQVTRDLLRPA